MSLRTQLRPLLPARVRGGGPSGEVEFVVIEADGADFVRATVHGHESHEVSLRLEPPATWSGACTCPLFRRSGACRHLWAVVREVDERGLEIARREFEGEATFRALDPRREVWQARLSAVAGALTEEALEAESVEHLSLLKDASHSFAVALWHPVSTKCSERSCFAGREISSLGPNSLSVVATWSGPTEEPA